MKKTDVEKLVEEAGLKSRFEHETTEKLETFHSRIWNFWKEEVFLRNSGAKTVVVFCHGGILRSTLQVFYKNFDMECSFEINDFEHGGPDMSSKQLKYYLKSIF